MSAVLLAAGCANAVYGAPPSAAGAHKAPYAVATSYADGRFHWRIAAWVQSPDVGGAAWQPGQSQQPGPGFAGPQAQVVGGRLEGVILRPPLVFLHVTAPPAATAPRLSMRMPQIASYRLDIALPMSLGLADRPWQSCVLGKSATLETIAAPPGNDVAWKPIRLPHEWQELGVTWVRTSVVIPEAWKGLPLWLNLGPVDDRDATFLNGRRVGRTDGWDVPRRYPVPPETIRWGKENTVAVAVDNAFAGGGLYRGPIELTAGEMLAPVSSFADPAVQPERLRAKPTPLGARLPLRPMAVRDGVLRYADGGEVALWGVNYYPQSWQQYESLKRLGVDPRRSIDEDFDDFQAMGLDVIRIHVFDSEITDAAGNLVRNDHLDVLDYLVAQCDRRGIYLMLTPIAWWDSPGARKDSFSRNTPKQAMSMWPGAWQFQMNYLRQFLTHVNPYTGRRLVDEPCMALWEIINEPTYWTYGDVAGGDPGETFVSREASRCGLEAVSEAWHAFIPGHEWESAQTYSLFRYRMVREYIDRMVAAMRAAGARQPIAYFANRWGEVDDVFAAIAESRCDAITLGAYPGGLPTDPRNDRVNHLGTTADSPPPARFHAKARLVYEFDASGTRDAVWMYPAMARHWRNAGVQVACQFQYDARRLAHVNWDWPQHYLNLWHVPGKAASFLIAAEAFRRLPRGAEFATPPEEQVFAPAAVSFPRNAALLAAPDCYMQAGPTDWRPLPLPDAPGRILSVGRCVYFDYGGTGIVDLRFDGDRATLRIYPDVDRVSDGLRGTLERPLTRLVDRPHEFQLHRAGWADAKVQRRDGAARVDVPGRAGRFQAVPGEYRLTCEKTQP